MKENNINGYIITLSDFHNSEYPCDFFKGVEYLSGFTGSNGTIFVDSKNCYLWTDGRYFTQCENEIKDTQIKMMKMGVEGEDTLYQIIEKLIDDRIEKLRYFMKENNINGYIITLSDFHNSEYPCDFFKGVEYLSGFTGSNGTIFVDSKNCYLWTDGRYFTQCENEIKDTQIKMMKMGVEREDTLYQIIEKKLNSGDCLAFDGRTVSFNEYKKFEEIAKKKNFKIKTGIDLLDKVWEARPSLPKEKAYLLDKKFSGESLESKLKRLREKMKEKNATVHILSTLEDIGWLLNLRGNDIEYNPFVLAYAIISMERVLLFTDISKFSNEIKNYFNENNIELFDYFDFYNYLENILLKNKILLDYNSVNCFIVKTIKNKTEIKNTINAHIKDGVAVTKLMYWLKNQKDYSKIKEMDIVEKVEEFRQEQDGYLGNIINEENPTVSLKAIKNETEIKNTINAHIKDGVAVTKLMYWLKNQKDYSKIKEMDIVEKVEDFRQEQEGYLGNNFSTISAFGKNSPMMHYLPSLDSNATLEEGNFLLLDSGGHYFEGSTDITRTFAIGNVSSKMKKHYTYVLKSLIDLSKLKFPKGTTCGNLDTVARSVIWNLGLEYRCATGHGGGYLGSVEFRS